MGAHLTSSLRTLPPPRRASLAAMDGPAPHPPLAPPMPNFSAKHLVYLEKGKQLKGENLPSQLLVPNMLFYCESQEENPSGCRRVPPPLSPAFPLLEFTFLSADWER